MNEIIVSICCQTYNHVGFIEETVESFLMQKTDFRFEILIRDDASTDGTTKIVQKYAFKFPELIKLLTYEENQFKKGVKPFPDNVKRAQGKYIAICEGDDHWTDPLKLQKQVDFLEENEEYVLICSNYLNTETNTEVKEVAGKFLDVTPFNILYSNPIGTLTVLLRTKYISSLKLKDYSMGDYPLWLHYATKGKIVKASDYTAVYRVLEESASARTNIKKRKKFESDVLIITKEFLAEFKLSKTEKREILRERYRNLFKILIETKDVSFFYYQYKLFLTIKFFNILDYKILLFGIKKIVF